MQNQQDLYEELQNRMTELSAVVGTKVGGSYAWVVDNCINKVRKVLPMAIIADRPDSSIYEIRNAIFGNDSSHVVQKILHSAYKEYSKCTYRGF